MARAPGRCAVVGAGLAGAAVASAFAQRGWQVDVFDAAARPAAGASALPAGLLVPHVARDEYNLLSRLTRAGVALTMRHARTLLREGVDWSPAGVDTRTAKGPRHHAEAAWIRPGALVEAWLDAPGIAFHGGTRIDAIAAFDHELVVLACALGSAALAPLRLEPVRGQVTWAHRLPGDAAALPARPFNGNGHFIPCAPVEGRDAWLTGSSYVRGDVSLEARDAEHAANLERLAELAPEVAAHLAPRFEAREVQAWTGVRCASTDRRPLVGFIDERVAVSTAMGSRGLTFAALCAEVLAARVHGVPLPISADLAEAIDVQRQGRDD